LRSRGPSRSRDSVVALFLPPFSASIGSHALFSPTELRRESLRPGSNVGANSVNQQFAAESPPVGSARRAVGNLRTRLFQTNFKYLAAERRADPATKTECRNLIRFGKRSGENQNPPHRVGHCRPTVSYF
jgi:hypothetical protein